MRDSSSEASTIETFVLAKIMYHLLNNNKGIIATLIVNKKSINDRVFRRVKYL